VLSARAPWWLRPAAVFALTAAGFVLRDHGLEKWAALLDSIALVVLFDPLITRALRAVRRRGARG
jgi:hypothetical protein